jgi:hypothetical protein
MLQVFYDKRRHMWSRVHDTEQMQVVPRARAVPTCMHVENGVARVRNNRGRRPDAPGPNTYTYLFVYKYICFYRLLLFIGW